MVSVGGDYGLSQRGKQLNKGLSHKCILLIEHSFCLLPINIDIRFYLGVVIYPFMCILVMYKGTFIAVLVLFSLFFVVERQRGYNICKGSAGFGAKGI